MAPLAGELGTLISVENLRRAVALYSLLQGIDTKACIHGIGDPSGQHLVAVPVGDGDQIREAPSERDIRNIC